MNIIQSKNKSLLIIAGVFLILFVAVALLTSGTQGFLIDENVAYWANQNTTPIVQSIMKYASFIGSSEVILIVTVLIGILFLMKRNWRHFFFFFTLSVGGVILNLTLKMIVQRARPGDEVKYIEAFNLHLEIQSYSFPSGHTMRATILFLFLMYLAFYFMTNNVWKYVSYVVCIVLLLTVALSRIMLDAHFATDIVGAILFSVAWFFICAYLFHQRKSRTWYPTYLHR